MEHLRPPGHLQFEGNVAENWRRWHQQFHVYMTAAEISQKPPPTQVAILLLCAGTEALEVYNTFSFAEGEDRNNVETVMSKYYSYCKIRKNTVFERYQFWQRNQLEDEPVDHWITDLETKAAICEFGEERDYMI